jgi:hypothetical protein
MPTLITVLLALVALLLVLGGLGAARRGARRQMTGKEAGKARPGESGDL